MFRCVNCAIDINNGARVCPGCHLNPYKVGATTPHEPIQEAGPIEMAALGAIFLPVFPVVSLGFFGIGLIGAVKNLIKKANQ